LRPDLYYSKRSTRIKTKGYGGTWGGSAAINRHGAVTGTAAPAAVL